MPRTKAAVQAVVLDTHCWIWAAAGDNRMLGWAGYAGRFTLPAISVWEVAMLCEKGRLRLEPDVDEWTSINLEPPVFLQTLTPQIALRAAQLDAFHGDPADRMIVATALCLDQTLVTADQKIIEWYRARPELANRVEPV